MLGPCHVEALMCFMCTCVPSLKSAGNVFPAVRVQTDAKKRLFCCGFCSIPLAGECNRVSTPAALQLAGASFNSHGALSHCPVSR